LGALDGKVAIVSGAGRGIGRGEALLLAQEGARVVVNDLGDEAKTVVDEIVATGGEAVANHDNVASWSGAEQLVRHRSHRQHRERVRAVRQRGSGELLGREGGHRVDDDRARA
jgi:NAD(P)-dependent dehydrogenase (short-subunit alcohol dehydrogenase family)